MDEDKSQAKLEEEAHKIMATRQKDNDTLMLFVNQINKLYGHDCNFA
jgi:hypothetical protein